MRRRSKTLVALLAITVASTLFFFLQGNQAERELEGTRKALRQQGFKVDLSEFDFSTPPEIRERMAAVFTTRREQLHDYTRRMPLFHPAPRLMQPIGSDTALVTWKQAYLEGPNGNETGNQWPLLVTELETNQSILETRRNVISGGPLRLEPIGGGAGALLPYLPEIKNVQLAFATEALVRLHQGRPQGAWPPLLASTWIVTEYSPEPIQICHLVRSACVGIALNTIWNCLQEHCWTEAQLCELQRRWEALDLWTSLPETKAYERANTGAIFEQERREPLPHAFEFKDLLRSPRQAFPALQYQWKQSRYRQNGIIEDESRMLVYFRDRELEYRRAVAAPDWLHMRTTPGVSNDRPFLAKGGRIGARVNFRNVAIGLQTGQGGFLGRIAHAEAQRRLIITALALQRYRISNGSYPERLSALAPGLLKEPPVDFMDGQPLRYRRDERGGFVLYSVGLDCIDNGGNMRSTRAKGYPDNDVFSTLVADIVWPRPASMEEAQAFQNQQHNARLNTLTRDEEYFAALQFERSRKRQAKIDEILKTASKPRTGVPAGLLDKLRPTGSNETNSSLSQMLALRESRSRTEPEKVIFELAMKYDAVTNLGDLLLCIDPFDDDSDDGCRVQDCALTRASNGNCLLTWNTIYECEGKHVLQAVLDIVRDQAAIESLEGSSFYAGPFTTNTVTNLCQFSTTSAHFEREYGATMRLRLAESNGSYQCDFKSTEGAVLRTITGTTSNSFVTIHWDLSDEKGNACTNNEFDTVFRLTLPDSGRSQTIRGP